MNIQRLAKITLILVIWSNGLIAQVKTDFKFDFRPGKTTGNYLKVLPSSVYTKELGYGFDFDSKPVTDGPFYFSVAVPEGNYKVTLTFGDLKEATETTVKAESRRLMLEDIKTNPGELIKKTFLVHVKDRKISSGGSVALKPRELTKLDWDDKLTLEFDGHTVLGFIEITRVEDQVTVFLAGNSTVVDQEDEPWASWGQMIPRFFKPGVVFSNHAESGLTLGSFIGSKRLVKILSIMKPGDYLFIEFGHNDQKEKGPNDGAYKSYSDRLKTFITEVRKKGGIPVIVTSTSRRSFGTDGKIENSLGDYPEAARKVAAAEKVPLIDLNKFTATLFNAMGEENSKKAFVHYPANTYPGQDKALADNTHFNTYGAYEIAKCVIEGIKDTKLDLAKYLMDKKFKFDPSKPDAVDKWHWPESPKNSVIKPDGN